MASRTNGPPLQQVRGKVASQPWEQLRELCGLMANDSSGPSANSMISAWRRRSVYARHANFMIGSELFLDFETAFNINGPEGCFSACYDYFERIIECEDHDPVHAEALRRLAMAKAWSSAYDQAVVHCEALIAAKISQASTELGRAGLTEMIQFRESRQKKIRERLDATQNR